MKTIKERTNQIQLLLQQHFFQESSGKLVNHSVF